MRNLPLINTETLPVKMFCQNQHQEMSKNPDIEKLKFLENKGYRFLCHPQKCDNDNWEKHKWWITPDGRMNYTIAGVVNKILDRQIQEAWDYHHNQISLVQTIKWQDYLE